MARAHVNILSISAASSPRECAFCYEPVSDDYAAFGKTWWTSRSDGGDTGFFCAKKKCVSGFVASLEELSTDTRGGEVLCSFFGQWTEELIVLVVVAAQGVETCWGLGRVLSSNQGGA